MSLRTRLRLLGAAAVCNAAIGTSSAAQIVRVPSSDASDRPIGIQAHVGYFQTTDRVDGQSGALWAFGEAFQYRLGVDFGLRSGSLGVTGTIATVPVAFSSAPGADGEIQFRQVMATFRSPEARVFHQLLEVSAGWAQWTNYSGEAVLSSEESKPRNALSIVIGYGFAFPLGERAAVTLVQTPARRLAPRKGSRRAHGARRHSTPRDWGCGIGSGEDGRRCWLSFAECSGPARCCWQRPLR